jgi:K+-transporting ATPase ATPase A chain
MSGQGIAQILFYAIVLVAVGYPLGLFMARVYGDRFMLRRGFGWLRALERGFYRLVRTDPTREQDWKSYAKTVLVFSVVVSAVLYGIQRLQGHLFLNPDHLQGVAPHIALNTTASFVTNTNWQFYGGEYTMSYLTQMAGLAVQNFVSAAVGMAVLAAVVRGIARRSAGTIGNFWVDLYRSLVYILLPLSIVLAVVLISQGVPQTFHAHATATTLQGAHQAIARGPVASQIAIKQLGTNGGGFYNSNSAVPFENPNGITNFLEMLSILLIPAAQVFMFGKMVLARRHAWAVFAVMFVVFAICPPSSTARPSSAPPVSTSPSGRGSPAGTWPTRKSASGWPTPQPGPWRRATPRTARSTAASTRRRRPAGRCPSSTCSSAR